MADAAPPWIRLPLGPMLSLRGRRSDMSFVRACEQMLGAPLPAVNAVARGAHADCLGLGPDEWMLLEPAGGESRLAAPLAAALGGTEHALVDVSGHRLGFRLSGAAGRELLAAGCSLDIETALSTPDSCAQTLLGRTSVILARQGEAQRFELLVRRSFAQYLETWLDRAAASVA